MKMNKESKMASLLARKEALKLKLASDKALVLQDLEDLKVDINPLKLVGNLVRNFLKPNHESGNKGMLEVGFDTAVNLAVGQILPYPKLAALAPSLIKNAYKQVEKPTKTGLLKALKWVSKKTKDPVPVPEETHEY